MFILLNHVHVYVRKRRFRDERQFVLLMICDTARTQMGSLGSSFLNRLPLKAHSYVLRKNEWSSLSSVQKSRQSAILFTLHAFSFSCPFGGVNSNQVPQNIENKQVFLWCSLGISLVIILTCLVSFSVIPVTSSKDDQRTEYSFLSTSMHWGSSS